MRKYVSCLLVVISFFVLILVSTGYSEQAIQEDNRFMELLRLVPETAKADGVFSLINYEMFRQANGISLFDVNNQIISREEFQDIILSKIVDHNLVDDEVLALSSYYTGWSVDLFISTIRDEYIGYNLSDVDAEINNIEALGLRFNFGSDVPDLRIAAIGRFSSYDTSTALDNRDDWPSWARENYMSEYYHDVTIHSWSGGNETNLKYRRMPPHIDVLGRAYPLAVTNRYLFVANSVQDVKTMIDSSQQEVPSLADVPEYALLAKGMYELNAYTAILGDESLANGPQNYENENKGLLLKKFVTFATGYGRDKKGIYIALALVHENPDNANDNIALLKQRINSSTTYLNEIVWSKYIYDTQIITEGSVLLAKLYTNDQFLWRYCFQNTLLLHEK